MKIIIIGDIHGRDTWKEIVATNSFDLCIFMGDYFDSFDLSARVQIDNFNEIIDFKQENKDKVILLTGNHDLHYLFTIERYSGYNHYHAADIEEVLLRAQDDMVNAFEIDGFLFTHAGVTKTWVKKNQLDKKNLVESINNLPLKYFAFSDKDRSRCGDHKSQGPMWVRPHSLQEDAIDGYIQIVGHTETIGVEILPKLALVDALPSGEYLKIEDGKLISCRL